MDDDCLIIRLTDDVIKQLITNLIDQRCNAFSATMKDLHSMHCPVFLQIIGPGGTHFARSTPLTVR